MILRDYLKELSQMTKENPKILDFTVIYSADDEGNSYHKVINYPCFAKANDLDSHYIEDVDIVEAGGQTSIKNCNTVIIN